MDIEFMWGNVQESENLEKPREMLRCSVDVSSLRGIGTAKKSGSIIRVSTAWTHPRQRKMGRCRCNCRLGNVVVSCSGRCSIVEQLRFVQNEL
jgi:hypothetical protein